MSTIKSSTEHLTLNADGSGKDIKFQANGVEKASISSAGAFTSTSIDATKLSGTVPNFTSTGIDDNATSTAITITSDGRGLSQFTAKAWVNFNGTGTVAIRDSHNVSSITDNGTGEWSVTYTNSMANANYSATTANAYVGSTYNITYAMISGYSASHISFYTQGEGSGLRDVTTMNLQVFGD